MIPFKRQLEEIYTEFGLRPTKRIRLNNGSSSSKKTSKFTAKPSDGVTEDMIKLYSSEDNFKTGSRYFEDDRVNSLFLSGNDLHATIGNNEVHVVLNVKDNTVQSAACNNVKQGFWCPHVVATLLTYVKNHDKVTKLESLESTLKSISREDLEQFILRTVSLSRGKTVNDLKDFIAEVNRKKQEKSESKQNKASSSSSSSSSSSLTSEELKNDTKSKKIESSFSPSSSSSSSVLSPDDMPIDSDQGLRDIVKNQEMEEDRDYPLMDLGQLKRLIQEQLMFDFDDDLSDDSLTASSIRRIINPFVQKARDLARFGHIHNAFEVVGAITSEIASDLLFDDMEVEDAMDDLCKTWIEIILRACKTKRMKSSELEIWRMQLQRWNAMTGLFRDAISTCDIGWESETIKNVFATEKLDKYKEQGLKENEKITKARMDILEEDDNLEASLKLARILNLGERASQLLLRMGRVSEILDTIPHIRDAIEAYDLALDMEKKDHSLAFLAILKYLELCKNTCIYDSSAWIAKFIMADLTSRNPDPSKVMSLTELSSFATAEALLGETMDTKKLVLDSIVSPLKSILMADMVTLTCLNRGSPSNEEIHRLAKEFNEKKLYNNALKLSIKTIKQGVSDTSPVEMAYNIAFDKKRPQDIEAVTEAVKQSDFSSSEYISLVDYLHNEKSQSMTALKLGVSALDAPTRSGFAFTDLYFIHRPFGSDNQTDLINMLVDIVLSINTQEAADIFKQGILESTKLEQTPVFKAAKKLYENDFKRAALSVGLATFTAHSREFFQDIYNMGDNNPSLHPTTWVANTAFELGDEAMKQVVSYCTEKLNTTEELRLVGIMAGLFDKHGHKEYAFELGLHTFTSDRITINGRISSFWVFTLAQKLGTYYLQQAVEKGIQLIDNGRLLFNIADTLVSSDPDSALSFYLKSIKMGYFASGKHAMRLALDTNDNFKIKEAIDVCKDNIRLADYALPVIQELWDYDYWKEEAVSLASTALPLPTNSSKAKLFIWFLDASLTLRPNCFEAVNEKILENVSSPEDAIAVAKKMKSLNEKEAARRMARSALDIEGLNDSESLEWIYEFADNEGESSLKQNAATRLFKQVPTLDNFLKVKEATSEDVWPVNKQNLLNFLRARTVTSCNQEAQGKLSILIHEGHASEALDVATACPTTFGQAQLLESFINQAIIQERNVQFINQVKEITERLVWRQWSTVTSTTTHTHSFSDKNDDPALSRILKTLASYDSEFTARVSNIHASLSEIRNYTVQTSNTKSYQHLVKILQKAAKHFDNADHPISEWHENVAQICDAHSTKRKLVRMIEDMCSTIRSQTSENI